MTKVIAAVFVLLTVIAAAIGASASTTAPTTVSRTLVVVVTHEVERTLKSHDREPTWETNVKTTVQAKAVSDSAGHSFDNRRSIRQGFKGVVDRLGAQLIYAQPVDGGMLFLTESASGGVSGRVVAEGKDVDANGPQLINLKELQASVTRVHVEYLGPKVYKLTLDLTTATGNSTEALNLRVDDTGDLVRKQ